MAVTDAGEIAGRQATRSGGLKPILLGLFILSLMLPMRLYVGELRIDPFRIYLLIGIIPMAIMMLSGRAGRLTLIDVFMALYALWIVVALTYNHGNWGFINGGITVVELLGGYMLGRLIVRSRADFERLVRYLMGSLVVISPFVVHEFLTHRWLIGEILGSVFPMGTPHTGERLGFSRVKASFPHPILYGLYASLTFACAYYLYRDRFGVMFRRVVFISFMTFASLSSGPLLSVVVQAGLIAWDRITKGRWMLLLGLSAIGYVVVDFLSNRTPVQIFVQTFTLDPQTAYWRIHIFEYGKRAVLNNPIFGIGHHEHPRPFWLTDSVDNFWLLNAMRYGLFGFGFLAAAILLNVFKILRLKNLSAKIQDVRLAYLVSFAGLAFTLSTVHVWDMISSLVFVFIGAGAFLYTGGITQDTDGEAERAHPDPDAAPAGGTAVRYRRAVRNDGSRAHAGDDMPLRRPPPEGPAAPQRKGATLRR